MYVFVVLSIVVVYANALNQEITYPGLKKDSVVMIGDDGEEIIGYFAMGENLARSGSIIVGERDVTFILYNRAIPNGWKITDVSELPKYMGKIKKLKCVTHGWLTSGEGISCMDIKNAYLIATDYNVIVMDWYPISGNVFYSAPMRATKDVAEYYGKFLSRLVDVVGINPKDIHLIGHSLGAHVSGFASRRVQQGKVGRVTALDPALPGFETGLVKEGGRLHASDAEFVDVIHTSSGYLGIEDPIGDVDFYPNGGNPPQPGCTSFIKLMDACSHGRSWQLFARSITLEEEYKATKCADISSLKKRKCRGDTISMGDPTPSHARGIYYIQTTDIDPFIYRAVSSSRIYVYNTLYIYIMLLKYVAKLEGMIF